MILKTGADYIKKTAMCFLAVMIQIFFRVILQSSDFCFFCDYFQPQRGNAIQ